MLPFAQSPLPALLAMALPFALSAIALVWQQVWEAQKARQRDLSKSAGEWLTETAAWVAPDVGLSVHDQDGLDAYWPGVGAIGLSRRTWFGRRVAQRAIAAHELGHAVNIRVHPLMAHLLPAARLIESLAWRGFVSSVLVLVLMGLPRAAEFAVSFAFVAVAAGMVIVVDEGMASLRGMAWLRRDHSLRVVDLRHASRSMAHSWSMYATRLAGQVIVLLLLPSVLAFSETVAPVRLHAEWGVVGGWTLAVATPFLVLRACQVIGQIFRPERVDSDFRLFTVMQREAQWESLSGLAVLAVLLVAHGQQGDWWFAAAAVLATIVAVGPLAGFGRALILLPIFLGLRSWVARTENDDRELFGDSSPDGAAPALMALYNSPPWYLRLSWLTHLGWIPMFALLVSQAALGA